MSAPKIALIGLGSMGCMLARTLAAAGHDLTVWNRGEERRGAFRGICAVAEDVRGAIKDAELVLTCLASYDATYAVLDDAGVIAALRGKTLVQMSTATPEEAITFGAWAAARGIAYLDAKIAVTPAQIGDGMTVIFYAGAKDVFDRYEPVLKCLGGRTTYMGEALDRAVMGDFAFLSVYFAGTIGVLHGAAFCAATGMDITQYFGLIGSFFHEIGARSESFRTMILKREYSDVQSALKTDLAGAVLLQETAERAGLNRMFAKSLVALMKDAVDRGHGLQDTAAMVECFLTP